MKYRKTAILVYRGKRNKQTVKRGAAQIEEEPIISFARNKHGINIKKRCGSCQRMEVNEHGARRCTIWSVKVSASSRCRRWAMSERMHRVGMAMGAVVRDRVTKEIIID